MEGGARGEGACSGPVVSAHRRGSPQPLQLQAWQAQPSLFLCFLPLLPGSPGQPSTEATTGHDPTELGDLIPGELQAPLNTSACRECKERARQPWEEENLLESPGVPSPGLGQDMSTRQGDAMSCINPEGSGGRLELAEPVSPDPMGKVLALLPSPHAPEGGGDSWGRL